jgi:hypothetical protein
MDYNTTNVKGFYSGMTSTQWRSFASYITAHSLVGAFQNAGFTLSTKYSQDMTNVPTHMQSAFAEGCKHAADGIDNGYALDVSGVSITDSSTGSNYSTEIDWHIDVHILWTGGAPAFSISIWHIHSVSN